MTMHVDMFPNPSGCTCGPFWSVLPPPPCPYHTGERNYTEAPVGTAHPVPYSPHMSPKELADLYRRLADALDPPVATTSNDTTTP